MKVTSSKVRAWCPDCAAWHPQGEHLIRSGSEGANGSELRAEPRPAPPLPRATRGSKWLGLSLFLFVILPAGVVAWSAAVYAVLLLLPHIKAAMP